jgi:hypothetical protein
MDNRKKESNWVGHIDFNCRLKHVIEGKIKWRIRRGRIRKQLLNDFKEMGRRTLKDKILDDSSGEFAWEEATDLR